MLFGQSALAERKAVLLIGNAKYSPSAIELKNPINDVAMLKAKIEAIGFDVTVAENVGRIARADALVRLEEKISTISDS